MKKSLLVASMLITGLFYSQENSIKVNPAALFGGTDLISYEHKFGDNVSGVIGAGYGSFKLGDSKYSSMGGGLQGRYYFTEAMTGFYGAVAGDFISGKVEIGNFGLVFTDPDSEMNTTKSEFNYTGFGGGLRAGYQWIFDSGFTIDINLGASYRAYNYKWDSKLDEEMYKGTVKSSGILPSGGFGIGYSF